MGPCPAGWICVHQSGVWWISSYLPYCQGRSTVGVCNLKHPLVGIEVCGKNHERVLNWFIPVTGARISDVKQQTTREILRATVGYRGNLWLIQFGSLNTEICVSRWKTGCFFSWPRGCCRVPAQQSKALQRWILEGLPLMDGLSEFCSDNLSGCNYLSYHNKVDTTPNILGKRKRLVWFLGIGTLLKTSWKSFTLSFLAHNSRDLEQSRVEFQENLICVIN